MMVGKLCPASAAAFGGACLLTLGLTSPASLGQQRIGVSGGVNPQATGTPPGAEPKRLVIGENIIFNERIATAAVGQAQILFVDESSLSLGPNSNMVIDKFVYNPDKGTGTMVLSATRGLFRFVGGKLSKQSNAVTIRTPPARIGVRGGAFLLNITANKQLEVVFLYGDQLVVTGTQGVTQTVLRPGFAITVAGPGAPPSEPFQVPLATLNSLLGNLDGHPGAHGGAILVPTGQTVTSSGISNAISNNVSANIAAAMSYQQPGEPPHVNVSAIENDLQENTVSEQAGLPEQQSQQTPLPGVVQITYAGHFKSTGSNGAAAGFTDPTGADNLAYSVASLILSDPAVANRGIFTALLGAPGPITGQVTIPLAPGTASVESAGTTSPLGPVSGTSFFSPDGSFFYANLTPVNAPSQREFIFGGHPVLSSFYTPQPAGQILAFNIQPDAALQSPVPFLTNSTGGNIPNPDVSPLYVAVPASAAFGMTNPHPHWLQASLAINGTGLGQTSALVINTGGFFTSNATGTVVGSGVVRGSYLAGGTSLPVLTGAASSTVGDGNNNNLFGTNSLSGFVLDQNGYSRDGSFVQQLATQSPLGGSPTSYGFTQPVTAAGPPAGIGASRTSQTLTGYFGGLLYSSYAGSGTHVPYAVIGTTQVTTDATNNRVAATFTGYNPMCSCTFPVTLYFGSVTGRNYGRSAYIDDNTFAAAESPNASSSINGNSTQSANLALVSSGAVPNNPLLTNGLCRQCEFLKWGYWTGQVNSTQPNGTAETDRAHINFWTAGIETPAAEIHNLLMLNAVGTYSGNAIGAVNDNGNNYLASGQFNMTYSFGPRSGSATISNFGIIPSNPSGQLFPAFTLRGGSGATYSGQTNTGAYIGTLNGSFYGPHATETGGNFAIQACCTSFTAAGVFAAHGAIPAPP